jgi:hypothetical protein
LFVDCPTIGTWFLNNRVPITILSGYSTWYRPLLKGLSTRHETEIIPDFLYHLTNVFTNCSMNIDQLVFKLLEVTLVLVRKSLKFLLLRNNNNMYSTFVECYELHPSSSWNNTYSNSFVQFMMILHKDFELINWTGSN